MRAHAQVRLLTNGGCGDDLQAADDQDVRLLELLKRDPSLFVEPIPHSNPYAENGGDGWDAQQRWWGTWAHKAATHGFFGAVAALLQAGVHPDDAGVFIRRPVWLDNWNSQPERLGILLAKGANADLPERLEVAGGFRASPNDSVLRRCVRRVATAVLSVWRVNPTSGQPDEALADKNEPRLRDLCRHIECARLLLRAGARRLDPVDFDVSYDDGTVAEAADGAWTAIGSTVEHMDQLEGHPLERALLNALVRELADAGASVDRPSGTDQERPLATAVRNRDLATFRILLELGAQSSDDVIVREEGQTSSGRHLPKALPLLETAFKAGGSEFQARVTEAIMQQSIHNAPKAMSAPEPRSKARAMV